VQSIAVNADTMLTVVTGDMWTSLTQLAGVIRWLDTCPVDRYVPHSSWTLARWGWPKPREWRPIKD